jgi:LmbE family N-acetylglucosaminyl deacetylase
VAWVLVGAMVLAWSPIPAGAQLSPPSAGGVVELDRLLHRLSESRRLLVIGAHPDDEDTEILALAALGYGAEAAYLSLSRGEGGQNLIGPELGEGLGLLRSQELVAARATDGAMQFFTRAFDYGFSRSLEEASRFWP